MAAKLEIELINGYENNNTLDNPIIVKLDNKREITFSDLFPNNTIPAIAKYYPDERDTSNFIEEKIFFFFAVPYYSEEFDTIMYEYIDIENNNVEVPYGDYNIELWASLEDNSLQVKQVLYCRVLYQAVVQLKDKFVYAEYEETPLCLGFIDEHKTKKDFDNYINITVNPLGAEEDINDFIKNNITLTIETMDNLVVEDISNVAQKYKISLKATNFCYFINDSDFIFFAEVIKKTTQNLILKNNISFNYNGEYFDITNNVKNNDGLKVIFLRNKVKEIGNYKIDFITEETDEFYSSSGSFNVEVVRSPSLIEHNEVINIIRNSLLEIMDNDYYYYKDYNVILAKEQEFIKLKQATPNAIYIVIKFGSASINFSQTVLPITLTAMSEQNKLDVCQKLLSDFVNKYNLETNEDSTIRQIYELPVVTSNFNKVFEGFRSILFVNGYFVISKNANFYELKSYKVDCDSEYDEKHIKQFTINKERFLQKINNVGGFYNFSYDGFWFLNGSKISGLEEYGITIKPQIVDTSDVCIKVIATEIWEDVPLLSFNFNADFQLDSQPFFNRDNFSHSKAKYGVLSFNINTYMLSDIDIVNKALNMALKQKNAGIDSEFKLKIKLKNGIELIDTFRLLSLNSQQTIAEIPVISLGFTN